MNKITKSEEDLIRNYFFSNLPILLSSPHSGKIYPSIAATALGAEILEFHAIFDRRQFGPDSKSSLEIDEIKTLVEGVNYISSSLQNYINKNDNSNFKDLKIIFEKSLAVNKDLKTGHILTVDDLESKKPNNKGISTNQFKEVIGRKINKNLKKWNFLNYTDISNE